VKRREERKLCGGEWCTLGRGRTIEAWACMLECKHTFVKERCKQREEGTLTCGEGRTCVEGVPSKERGALV
jgi:hypothetical protein